MGSHAVHACNASAPTSSLPFPVLIFLLMPPHIYVRHRNHARPPNPYQYHFYNLRQWLKASSNQDCSQYSKHTNNLRLTLRAWFSIDIGGLGDSNGESGSEQTVSTSSTCSHICNQETISGLLGKIRNVYKNESVHTIFCFPCNCSFQNAPFANASDQCQEVLTKQQWWCLGRMKFAVKVIIQTFYWS